MSTVTDLSSEDRLNNVKENLAGVREVIVKADTIVDGEYYALVGGSILTFLFGFVWGKSLHFMRKCNLLKFECSCSTPPSKNAESSYTEINK